MADNGRHSEVKRGYLPGVILQLNLDVGARPAMQESSPASPAPNPGAGFDFPAPAAYIGNSSLQTARGAQRASVGGVTASTEMLAAERHAGVHTPVIACKTTIANTELAYAA